MSEGKAGQTLMVRSVLSRFDLVDGRKRKIKRCRYLFEEMDLSIGSLLHTYPISNGQSAVKFSSDNVRLLACALALSSVPSSGREGTFWYVNVN